MRLSMSLGEHNDIKNRLMVVANALEVIKGSPPIDSQALEEKNE